MNKIKILSFVLACTLFVLSFVACDSNKSNSKSDNDPNASANTDTGLTNDFVFTLLDDGTYEVEIKETSVATALTLPTTHNGVAVTSFGGIRHTADASPTNITDITIPKEITVIKGQNMGAYGSIHDVNIHISDLLLWCKNEFPWKIGVGCDLYVNGNRLAGQLILPEGLAVLKKGPLSFLEDIVSVTLPSTLTSIEEGALYNGYHREIKEVINHSSLAIKAGYKNNGGIAKNAKYVHSDASSKLEFLDGFVIDEHTVINYVGEKTDLVFPVHSVGMYNIGSYAFSGRDDITSIVFSDSVLKIQSGAFARCNNLTSVTVSSSVIEIGYNAFGECEKLNNAIFKDTTGWYYEYTGSYYVSSYWVGNKFYPAHDEYYTSTIDISELDDEVGAAGKLTSSYDDETWLKK